MYVYIIGSTQHNYYKVGISSDPEDRLRQILTHCPFEVKLLFTCYKGDDAKNIEAQIHKQYKNYNCHREWFLLPSSLLPKLEQDIIKTQYDPEFKMPFNNGTSKRKLNKEKLKERKKKRDNKFNY